MGILSRLKYTVSTLSDIANPLDKDFGKVKLEATTKSKTVNKAIETVANHPFAAAGVVAGGIVAAGVKSSQLIGGTAVKTGLQATSKALGSAASNLGKSFSTATIGQKALVTTGSLFVAGKAVNDPLGTAQQIAKVPKTVFDAGVISGKDKDLKSKGSELLQLAKDNPLTAGAVAAGGVLLAGKAVPIIATALNTQAMNTSTRQLNDLRGLSDVDKKEAKRLKQEMRDYENALKKGKIQPLKAPVPELPPMTNPLVEQAPKQQTVKEVATVTEAIPAAIVAPPPISTAKTKKKKKAAAKKKKKRKVVKKKAPKKKKKKAIKRVTRRKPKKTVKKRKVYKKKKKKKGKR